MELHLRAARRQAARQTGVVPPRPHLYVPPLLPFPPSFPLVMDVESGGRLSPSLVSRITFYFPLSLRS